MAKPKAHRALRKALPSLTAWVLVLIVAVAALAVQAQTHESLGLTPGQIDLPAAQAGESYVSKVQVQNQYDSTSTMTIDRDGAAGAWASTSPANTFTIPPGKVQNVTVTITVPAGMGPGTRLGEVRFTTEPKNAPSGSGAATRAAVGLLLNVTVGGERVVKLVWKGVRVPDATAGAAPVGYATVENDGNVAAAATMEANISVLGEARVIQAANATARLDPGTELEIPVAFAAALPTGQYVMHFVSRKPAGFTRDVDFRVLRPGEGPQPHGLLNAIRHVPYGNAGQPVRIDGWFENDGPVAIGSAKFTAEVRQGDALLAALASDVLAVPAGQRVNLTVYWTPPGAGAYTIVGHVTYDGYSTLESTSPLNVNAATAAFPWWLLWLLAAVAVAVIAVAARRRR